MADDQSAVGGRHELTRRRLIKFGIGSAAAVAVGGPLVLRQARGASAAEPTRVGLAATDGWISLPIGADGVAGVPEQFPIWPDELADDYPARNLYSFGFRDVTTLNGDYTQISQLRNLVQHTAPLLYRGKVGTAWRDFHAHDRIRIDLWNLGLAVRPDLADGHTLHWHGFPNQIPYFDGVPETSISVPVGRSFTYEFVPEEPGTYMYHCHFEDVEHVQMGMVGVVFVRPADFDASIAAAKTAYGAGTESEFDREFAWMISEIDLEEHWLSSHVQQPDWTEHRPGVFMINGRTFPDTLLPGVDVAEDPIGHASPGGIERLHYQPSSALIEGNSGERLLVRIANLGFRSHNLQLSGLPMKVVAIDAKPLVDGRVGYSDGHAENAAFDTGPRAGRLYETNSIDVPPGRSVDLILELPTVTEFTRFPFGSRGITGSGDPLGGGSMRSEVHVHPAGSLGPQPLPNF